MSAEAALPATGNPTAGSIKRPSIRTLTLVELRKTVDTRAGLWLLAITGLAIVGGAIAQSLASSGADAEATSIFQTVASVASYILPVVGILLVTSEWTQRTALITFVLTPVRERVVTAKFLAAVLVGLLAAILALSVSLFGGAVLGEGVNLSLGEFGQGALLLVIALSIGVALGLALRNSPLAIVVYFVGPIMLGIIGAISEKIFDYTSWLDLSGLSGLEDVSTPEWDRIAVTVLLWVALPLVIGLFRLNRSNID